MDCVPGGKKNLLFVNKFQISEVLQLFKIFCYYLPVYGDIVNHPVRSGFKILFLGKCVVLFSEYNNAFLRPCASLYKNGRFMELCLV